MAEVQERRVEVGGIGLNVAEAGSGPAVVLLHGFPDSWRLWRHQIDALAEAGFRVIAPDLRGFGQSDKPEGTEQYAIPLLAGDVSGVLDALGVERAAVVGHDWGSAVAWVAASFLPDRVDKLVAVSVGHPGAFAAAGLRQKQLSWYMLWFQFPGVAEAAMPEDDWAFFRRWLWAGAAADDEDMQRQLADLSRPGALTSALNVYRANIAPETFHKDSLPFELPPIVCPAMGVWSSGDEALGEEQMTGSARFCEGPWRYERIEDVGHWVPVHAPKELSALLVDFLAG